MSIKYSGYVFDEPVLISNWNAPYRAGLYAILVPDQSVTPRPFRVIYFGESGNMSERGFLKLHAKFPCWIREAGSENNLYVALLLMPDSTPEQRRVAETQLIANYNPACNRT